jgi:hypothetical protein
MSPTPGGNPETATNKGKKNLLNLSDASPEDKKKNNGAKKPK